MNLITVDEKEVDRIYAITKKRDRKRRLFPEP